MGTDAFQNVLPVSYTHLPNFASEVDKDSVALNKDATTGTAVFTLSNAVNYPDGSYTLRVTSKNGGLKDATGCLLYTSFGNVDSHGSRGRRGRI